MSKGLTVVVVLVVIVAIFAGIFISAYNGVVSLGEEVDSKWAQIDNQLKRRTDLVPDLVKVANKFAANEKEIIDNVVNARAKLAGANSVEEKSVADQELSSAISKLLVVVENYPTLKQDETYIRLMDELAGTENRISVARRDYNEAVKTYNVKIKTFPTVLLKGMIGASEKSFYEVSEADKQKPEYDL